MFKEHTNTQTVGVPHDPNVSTQQHGQHSSQGHKVTCGGRQLQQALRQRQAFSWQGYEQALGLCQHNGLRQQREQLPHPLAQHLVQRPGVIVVSCSWLIWVVWFVRGCALPVP